MSNHQGDINDFKYVSSDITDDKKTEGNTSSEEIIEFKIESIPIVARARKLKDISKTSL